jgi:hypothetical protein
MNFKIIGAVLVVPHFTHRRHPLVKLEVMWDNGKVLRSRSSRHHYFETFDDDILLKFKVSRH